MEGIRTAVTICLQAEEPEMAGHCQKWLHLIYIPLKKLKYCLILIFPRTLEGYPQSKSLVGSPEVQLGLTPCSLLNCFIGYLRYQYYCDSIFTFLS